MFQALGHQKHRETNPKSPGTRKPWDFQGKNATSDAPGMEAELVREGTKLMVN